MSLDKESQKEEAWCERLTLASARALYLHVPFCARKCAYCDFASRATASDDPLMAAYAQGLEEELRQAEAAGLLEGCETGYVGGGTPTLLGAQGLGGLIRATRTCAPSLLELTSEANPDSLSDAVLDALASSGATRVSIGVQSLDDGELAKLGRIHSAAEARERVGAAVASGLDVSCDLMCAIPDQTDASWRRSLEGVVSLGVGHISVYPLAIEEGTPLAARVEGLSEEDLEWNSSDVQASRMTQAQVQLDGYGYDRYEVASYARAGKACRHNVAYWTGQPYLGFGTEASSMLTLEGYLRLCRITPRLPAAPEGTARVRLTCRSGARRIASSPNLGSLDFDCGFLTVREAAAEDRMLGARLVRGLDPGLGAFARRVVGPQVDQALGEAQARGLLDAGLAPTQDGWLLGNELYGLLWDLAEAEPQTASTRPSGQG